MPASTRSPAQRKPRRKPNDEISVTDVPPLLSLAAAIDRLTEAELIEMYVRMVHSRHYLPLDVLDAGVFFAVCEARGRFETMHEIGEIVRGRLGIT